MNVDTKERVGGVHCVAVIFTAPGLSLLASVPSVELLNSRAAAPDAAVRRFERQHGPALETATDVLVHHLDALGLAMQAGDATPNAKCGWKDGDDD